MACAARRDPGSLLSARGGAPQRKRHRQSHRRRQRHRHVTSCHVTSCRVVSCRVLSQFCFVMSSHVLSCHVVSCRVMSGHVLSCHVVSCRGRNPYRGHAPETIFADPLSEPSKHWGFQPKTPKHRGQARHCSSHPARSQMESVPTSDTQGFTGDAMTASPALAPRRARPWPPRWRGSRCLPPDALEGRAKASGRSSSRAP